MPLATYSTNDWTLLLIVIGIVAFTILYLLNHHTVEHPERERIVMRHVFFGWLHVIERGTEFFPPWWVPALTVHLNRQRQTVTGNFAVTKDQRQMLVSYTWDDLSGRRVDENNGKVLYPLEIDNEMVKRAYTKVDFSDRVEYMKSRAAPALDKAIGLYTAAEIMNPAAHLPIVPPWPTSAGTQPKVAFDRNIMLDQLAKLTRDLFNEDLKDLPYCVVGFEIQDLQYANQATLDAQSYPDTVDALKAGADRLPANQMSLRERLSLGTPAQGQVAIAESVRDGSENLRHFGRG